MHDEVGWGAPEEVIRPTRPAALASSLEAVDLGRDIGVISVVVVNVVEVTSVIKKDVPAVTALPSSCRKLTLSRLRGSGISRSNLTTRTVCASAYQITHRLNVCDGSPTCWGGWGSCGVIRAVG